MEGKMDQTMEKVVVIGSGAMGSAIAAQIANVGISVTILDIVPRQLNDKEQSQGLQLSDPKVRNRIVTDGWEACVKSRPPALYSRVNANRVRLGNLEDDFNAVSEADWVIEVIVEDLKIKKALMQRIDEARKPSAIVSTNTSGLLVSDISAGLSKGFRTHFMGTHFFNPPRYMKLLEVIPCKDTDPGVLAAMIRICEGTLGKTVVLCKDSPNFIANRYISFSGGYTMGYAQDHGFTVSEVDALSGKLVGHPQTATYRLYDLIGLDVIDHVNDNLYSLIPDDPHRDILKHQGTNRVIKSMVAEKSLGNKTNGGFYRIQRSDKGKTILERNLASGEYSVVPAENPAALKAWYDIKDTGKRIKKLCSDGWKSSVAKKSPAAFVWNTTAFTINYSAWVMPKVCDSLYSFDTAIRLGFGHELGPFEIWDALGVADCVKRLADAGFKAPAWVSEMLANGKKSFYRRVKGILQYYDPATKNYVRVPPVPGVMKFEYLKGTLKKEVYSNPGASLVDLGDGVLDLEFHSKANILNADVNMAIEESMRRLESDQWIGMVIGNDGSNFSGGADLGLFVEHIENKAWDKMSYLVNLLQQTLLKFRYGSKPVVAAPFGATLGGGSEVMLASSAICAAAETYIGQIEPSVGVVPALGGCKELLRRVLAPAMRRSANTDPFPLLLHIFQLIVMNKVSGSAQEAKDWGFLMPTDRIVINREYLLSSARRMVLDLSAAGYRPEPRKDEIYAVGSTGYGFLMVQVYNMKVAGYITEHEALIASKVAYILCGGELSQPQWVDSQYILDLEREAFISLLGEEKTRERIMSVLTTGKQIRN